MYHFKTLEDFANETKDKNDVYLHIDVFESGQPTWASPPTQEKVDAITSLGFRIVKEITGRFESQDILIGLILHRP